MKVTVMVECDEGVMASSSFTMEELCMPDGIPQSIESALINRALADALADEGYAVRFTAVADKFVHLTETHASIVANKIVNFFRDRNSLITSRNTDLGNGNCVRDWKQVKDIDEALKWKSEGI